MNLKQKTILFISMVAFLTVGLNPPWVKITSISRSKKSENIGHFLIISPPKVEEKRSFFETTQIDFKLLNIYWINLIAFTVYMVLILSDPKQKGKRYEKKPPSNIDIGPLAE